MAARGLVFAVVVVVASGGRRHARRGSLRARDGFDRPSAPRLQVMTWLARWEDIRNNSVPFFLFHFILFFLETQDNRSHMRTYTHFYEHL
jgi:hypothetical protein